MPKPPAAAARLPASISRAIILSCDTSPDPNVLPPVGEVIVEGNGRFQKFAADVAPIAAFNRLPVASACSPTSEYACTWRFGYGRPRMFVRACSRAPPTPDRLIAPEVDTVYCETMFPTSNM